MNIPASRRIIVKWPRLFRLFDNVFLVSTPRRRLSQSGRLFRDIHEISRRGNCRRPCRRILRRAGTAGKVRIGLPKAMRLKERDAESAVLTRFSGHHESGVAGRHHRTFLAFRYGGTASQGRKNRDQIVLRRCYRPISRDAFANSPHFRGVAGAVIGLAQQPLGLRVSGSSRSASEVRGSPLSAAAHVISLSQFCVSFELFGSTERPAETPPRASSGSRASKARPENRLSRNLGPSFLSRRQVPRRFLGAPVRSILAPIQRTPRQRIARRHQLTKYRFRLRSGRPPGRLRQP